MKIKILRYLLLVLLLCCGKSFMAAAQTPDPGTVTFQYQSGANQVVGSTTYAYYVPTSTDDAGLGFEFVAKGTGATSSKYLQVGFSSFSGNDAMMYYNRSNTAVTVSTAYIMSAATGAATGQSTTLPTPGGQFDLTSIDLEAVSVKTTVSIQAYRNGTAVGSPVTTAKLSTTAKTTIDLSTNANFSDIDEIAITGFNSDGLYVDNIVTTAMPTAPTITTTAASGIWGGSATLGGSITSIGSSNVTVYGVAYSTSNTTPTTANSVFVIGGPATAATTFSNVITGLAPNTTYYIRAYATNSAGTAYGSALSFTTLAIPAISYTSPTYTAGAAITALSPTNTGGAVPANTYLASSNFGSGYSQPFNMDFDAAGNAYEADYGTGNILKITPAGVVTTFVNALTADDDISSIAVGPGGNIYVSDQTNNKIFKITPAGVVSTFISAGLNNPYGLTFDSAGNLWIADYGDGKIFEVLYGTAALTTYATGYNGPWGLAFDSSGRLYVSERDGGNIYRSGGGTTKTQIGTNYGTLRGIAIDAAGDIFFADYDNNRVSEIPLGVTNTTATAINILTGLNIPRGISLDPTGNFLYVMNTGSNAIVKLSITGYTYTGTLPPGLSFDYTTGTITGTPTTAAAATTITVTAYNSAGKSSTTFTITIKSGAPTVTQTVTSCGGGSITLTASGGSPTGGTYKFYSDAAGTVLLQSSTSTTYTTSIAVATNFYVSYTPPSGTASTLTAITATVNTTPFVNQTTANGLKYSYPFTGNANDVSGSGNTGTAQTGASLTLDRFGVTSSAYLFNGTTGYISTTTNIAAPTVFMINMWFKTTSSAGGVLIGFNNVQTGNSGTFDRSIYMNTSGQVIFGVYDGGTDTVRTGTAYNDGTWHMVTASLSANGVKLYMDGVLASSNATWTTAQSNTGWWRIGDNDLGGWPDGAGAFFNGSLDDVSIYNRELSSDDVYSLLGAEVTPVCVGGTLAFSANTNTGSTYSWSGPNGFSSSLQNPTIPNATAAATGNYTVVVVGTDGCSSTQTIYGEVNPLPNATFTAPNTVLVNTNTTLTLATAYNTSLYNYSYNLSSDGSGSLVSPPAGTNFIVKWSTIGAKTVTLTQTNIVTGCTATYTAVVNVGQDVTLGNYGFNQPVTLNTTTSGVTTTLTDFPALVYIKEDALKAGTGYVQNCANNIQFPTGGSTGYDFAFTLNGNTQELFYQVQNYDPTTGTLTAWVQIPSIPASSSVALTFYFGSKVPNHTSVFTASTWPPDYVDVYHFEEGSATATVVDATIAANNATQTGTSVATGQIGSAYTFNGGSSVITSLGANNNVTGSFTLSAWVNSASFVGHTDQKVITNEWSSTAGGYKMSLFGSTATTVYNEVETRATDGTTDIDRSAPGGTKLSPNTWYYVQGVYDNSTGTFYSYVNGSLDRSQTGSTGAGANGKNVLIGSDFGGGNWFNGIIDECRISNIPKSADWIKEEYYNQTNPTTYTTALPTITTNTTNASALGIPGGAIVYTWTGAAGTSPTATTNWKSSASGAPTGVPPFDGTCSLIIPGGLTNYPTLTANESVYGLTLGAGATINLASYTLNVGCHIYNNATSGNILYGTSTATINFNGSLATQYFYGNNSITTSNLANLTLNNSAAGTLDITGGNVSIYNSLAITKGNILVDNAGNGSLTLISQASGTANVNTIPSPYTIKGNVIAQRYLPGGATGYRTYRLLTLPVNISNSFNQVSTEAFIDLHSLNASILTAGPGTGFSFSTATTNPLLYLYDESRAQNFSAYIAGKNVGIYSMTGSPSYNVTTYGITLTATKKTAQVPVGNAVQVYYVGPLSAVNLATTAPVAATTSATGYINQGTIATYIYSTGSTNLSYSPATNNTAAKGPGLNQVGNPYPSTIDLDSLYFDNRGSSPYTSNIGPTFWELKQPNNMFVAYMANHTTSSTGAEAYIASGEGFFVQALSTSSTLTFNEKDKVNVNIGTSTTPVLILGQKLASSAAPISAAEVLPSGLAGLHLQISQDTSAYTQTGIYFNKSWNDKYSPLEDAIDLDGTAPKVYLSSYSTDGTRLCINGLGDYSQGKTVKLYASATTSGTYTINLADINNIDALYNVYLRDHKLNDSVNLRNANSYTFTINTGDTTTYGANRFDLVLERQAVSPYQLLTFTGQKVSSGVQLNWAAQNTGNYTGFILQKEGANNTFSPIYTVQSSNNNNGYNFVDNNPVVGNNIYRLAQNDINGNITYSSLITIGYNSVSSNGYFSVYPNPSSDIINILVNSTTTTASNYTADIYNTSGALMDHRVLNTYMWTEDISSYKEGIYIIVLKNMNGDVLAKSKFIKTK